MLEELDELDSTSGWVPFFQKLNWVARANAGPQKIAKLPENRQYNRYRDVLPYDHSRIILNAEDGETDYINANLVEVPHVDRRYILCQGPLKHTSVHFWQMVWEQKSKAIIMLNRVIEKNQIKCYQYWPCGEAVGHTDVLTFGNYRVTWKDESMSEYYTVKTLELFNIQKNEKRNIFHYHYLNWPDFGVPNSPATFLSFLFEAHNAGVLSSDVGPAIVHCSAGIGRSGTYIMVDSILKEVEKTKDLNGVNIKERLLEIRKYRLGLIQTPDQLRFTYAAILEGTHMLLPDVYEKALDKFMESRGVEEEEEDEEPPPLPPPRKRPEPHSEANGDVEKKKKKESSETDSHPSKGKNKRRLSWNLKEMFKVGKKEEKGRKKKKKKVVEPTLSSDESDGEDEIIDLSDSSLSDTEETSSKQPTPSPPPQEKVAINVYVKSPAEVVVNKTDEKEHSRSKERETELRQRQTKVKQEETSQDEESTSKEEKRKCSREWVISIVQKSLIVIGICAIAFLAYRYFRYSPSRIPRAPPKIPRPRRGGRKF